VTIRELFSHTSGFVYERWDADLHVYRTRQLARGVKAADIKEPLMFDPGTKWEYGTSTMWLGRVVEAVSGESLEDYFQRHIFTPLGMKNSSFIVPEEKGSDLVSLHQREPDGTLKEISPNRLPHPTFFDGGSSLTSSARDYGIFMEMILGDGELHGVRILKASSVREMEENQIGGLTLYPFKTTNPAQSVDGELPGHLDKFGLGFAISTHGEPGGRAPGSVAWAGLENTYFWIDPRNHLGAVLMMQILPFLDPAPIAVFRDFEHEIYSPGRP
jgi:CubicO group peptidase (beta-lactamase class C family)